MVIVLCCEVVAALAIKCFLPCNRSAGASVRCVESHGSAIDAGSVIWRYSFVGDDMLAVVTSDNLQVWGNAGNGLTPVPLWASCFPKGVTCSDVWGLPEKRAVYVRKGETESFLEVIDFLRKSKVMSRPLRKDWGVNTVAISVDGRELAVLQQHCYDQSDAEMEVYDLGKGGPPSRIAIPQLGGNQKITNMAFSPDGNTLALGSKFGRCAIGVVSLPSMVLLWHRERRGGVDGMAFSPNGASLYVCDTCGGITRVETTTGKVVWRKEVNAPGLSGWGAGAKERVTAIDVSKDGQYLAAAMGYSRKVLIWDANTGTQVGTLDSRSVAAYLVLFSSNGKGLWVCGAQDRRLSFFEVERN